MYITTDFDTRIQTLASLLCIGFLQLKDKVSVYLSIKCQICCPIINVLSILTNYRFCFHAIRIVCAQKPVGSSLISTLSSMFWSISYFAIQHIYLYLCNYRKHHMDVFVFNYLKVIDTLCTILHLQSLLLCYNGLPLQCYSIFYFTYTILSLISLYIYRFVLTCEYTFILFIPILLVCSVRNTVILIYNPLFNSVREFVQVYMLYRWCFMYDLYLLIILDLFQFVHYKCNLNL